MKDLRELKDLIIQDVKAISAVQWNHTLSRQQSPVRLSTPCSLPYIQHQYKISGFGFRVSGSGVWVPGWGMRDQGLGFRIWVL